METLWYKMEYLRQKMNVTALKKGISHPEVLIVSQRLDEVIQEFYKLAPNQKTGWMNTCSNVYYDPKTVSNSLLYSDYPYQYPLTVREMKQA